MLNIPLDFLKRHVDPNITGSKLVKIKNSTVPAQVFRLVLDYAEGQSGVSTVIWKNISPDWPNDSSGAKREVNFYAKILLDMDIPKIKVYFAGSAPKSKDRWVLLEDISKTHYMPPVDHTWNKEELRLLLKTYAQFHSSGSHILPNIDNLDWLCNYSLEKLPLQDMEYMVHQLVQSGLWQEFPHFEQILLRLIDQSKYWSNHSNTIIHNDLYPPNIAFPIANGEVFLLDWDMVGWGYAGIDIAYLFLQPFQSGREIKPRDALEIYWAERYNLDGAIPTWDEIIGLQNYTNLLFAFSLIPVAYRVMREPYKEGTAADQYWKAMFPVLNSQLQHYCRVL